MIADSISIRKILKYDFVTIQNPLSQLQCIWLRTFLIPVTEEFIGVKASTIEKRKKAIISGEKNVFNNIFFAILNEKSRFICLFFIKTNRFNF